MTYDKQGRPYVKLSALKAGDWVEVDGDFECMEGEKQVAVFDEELYVPCRAGRHFLRSQADDGDTLIGIMLIRLTHADTSARTIGIPEQSRSAPLEG